MVGWIDIMESCADMRGRSLQPLPWSSTSSAVLYFSAFNVIVNLFLVKLFVGVMASSFASASGTALVTEHQKQWFRIQRMIENFNPSDPHSRPVADDMPKPLFVLRTYCFDCVEHRFFCRTIDCCIALNCFALAIDQFPESATLGEWLRVLNVLFLVVFSLECALKLIAYGPRSYWHDAWNRVDFLVIGASWAGRLTTGVASGAELVRAFRTVRIFLVMQKNEGLTNIFSCLLTVLPPAFYLALLFFLLIFVYAVLGMQLFGNEPTQPDPLNFRAAFNDQNNFGDFEHACRLLFQITFGQSMTAISHDLRHFGVRKVFVFFGSYYFLSCHVMLNLFVGMVVDVFDLQHVPRAQQVDTDEQPEAEFPVEDMYTFREAWRQACLRVNEQEGFVLTASQSAACARNPAVMELRYSHLHSFLQDLAGYPTAKGCGTILNVRALDPDWVYHLQT